MEYFTENSTRLNNGSSATIGALDIPDDVQLFIISLGVGIFVFALISVTVNTLNIIAIVSFHPWCKLSYWLFINLLVSDALLAFTVSVLYILQICMATIPLFNGEGLLCSGVVLFCICNASALLTILFMSVDLCFMVKFPLKHLRILKQSRFQTVIWTIWMVALLPNCVAIVNALLSLRTMPFLAALMANYLDTLWFSLILAGIAFLAIVISYLIVIKEIYTAGASNQTANRKIKKSAITMCLIVSTYFLLYLPGSIYLAIINILQIKPDWNLARFEHFTNILMVMNTVCDPLIYAFRLPKVRQALIKRIRYFGCSKNENTAHEQAFV